MNKVIVTLGSLLFLNLALVSGDDLSEQDLLWKKLSSGKEAPTIIVSGHYASFSAYDSDKLSPVIETDIDGIIDCSTGSVKMHLFNCSRRLATEPVTYDKSSFLVSHDAEKWLLVKFPSNKAELPANVTSIAVVTEGVPKIFLQSADALCFPLFPILSDVVVNQDRIPFLAALSGKTFQDMLTTSVKRDGTMLTLLFKSQCSSDEFTFDEKRGFAFVGRKTDFGGCLTSKSQPKLVNNLEIKDVVTLPSGLTVPTKAVFEQLLGDKVMIHREWDLKISESSETLPVAVAVPSSSYVTDERFGISFFTKRDTK